MNSSTAETFPWPIIIGIIGFFIAFFVQFRLKHHIDRAKVAKIENLAELYPNSIPPKKILTKRGMELYRWFYIGFGIFVVSIIVTIILYGKNG